MVLRVTLPVVINKWEFPDVTCELYLGGSYKLNLCQLKSTTLGLTGSETSLIPVKGC